MSRDRNPEEFLSYYGHMPWLAVTWERFQSVGECNQTAFSLSLHCLWLGQTLGHKYGMKGIPHLVFIEPAAGDDEPDILTTDGRSAVMRDKYGLGKEKIIL